MLRIKEVVASEIKVGDRIIDPAVIKPYITEEGHLPDELAEEFILVLAVGVLKNINAERRDEILKNFCYSLDTIIIMVSITGEIPKEFIEFMPNGTMNLFHSPSDIILVLI